MILRIIALICLMASVSFAGVYSVETVNDDEQSITQEWVNYGDKINMIDFDSASAFVTYAKGSATNPMIRVVGYISPVAASGFVLGSVAVSGTHNVITPLAYKLPDNETMQTILLSLNGSVPFIQFQVSADSTGATISGLSVTKAKTGR